MKPKAHNKYARRATAVVETAVMAPLMVTAMFGMMEVGYAFMIKQTVTLASREGARAAALPGGTTTDIQSAVDHAMAGPNLDGYAVTTNLSTMEASETEVWVEVSIPFNRVSFTGHLMGGGSFNITSRTTMRREGISG